MTTKTFNVILNEAFGLNDCEVNKVRGVQKDLEIR